MSQPGTPRRGATMTAHGQRHQAPEARDEDTITHLCGITGAEPFAASLRQWQAMLQRGGAAVSDEYHHTFHSTEGDLIRLLDRIGRQHAERPLLAGRVERDAACFKHVVGVRSAAAVWRTCCSAPSREGTATFCTIERCGAVLLSADYRLYAAGPAVGGDDLAEAGISVEFHAVFYLSGWPRYLRLALFPLLWSGVLQTAARIVADSGTVTHGGCRHR